MKKRPDYIPADYTLIKIADSADAMLATPISAEANCVLFPRDISGLSASFSALSRHFRPCLDAHVRRTGVCEIELELDGLKDAVMKSGAGGKAGDLIVADVEFLLAKDFDRVALRLVRNYTGVELTHEFHADLPVAQFACCNYTDPVTETIRVGDIRTTVHDESYAQGARFYLADAKAEIFGFRPGDLWHHATMQQADIIEPFPHRGPVVPDSKAGVRMFLTATRV
jgi:hypothetical protein